jgi:hypothetical protein
MSIPLLSAVIRRLPNMATTLQRQCRDAYRERTY